MGRCTLIRSVGVLVPGADHAAVDGYKVLTRMPLGHIPTARP
jgi:hypothetical protein